VCGFSDIFSLAKCQTKCEYIGQHYKVDNLSQVGSWTVPIRDCSVTTGDEFPKTTMIFAWPINHNFCTQN
jgi:hypothetical protein